jgi:hypothetical protein
VTLSKGSELPRRTPWNSMRVATRVRPRLVILNRAFVRARTLLDDGNRSKQATASFEKTKLGGQRAVATATLRVSNSPPTTTVS